MGNSFPPVESGADVAVEAFDTTIPVAKVTVKKVQTVDGIVPLPEAELVVSAGRGMKAPENWYPLKVLVCNSCWLVQTEDFVGASEMFTEDYAYYSSYSSSSVRTSISTIVNLSIKALSITRVDVYSLPMFAVATKVTPSATLIVC